MDWIYKWK